MQRSVELLILGVDIGLLFKQDFADIDEVADHCHMQGSALEGGECIYLSTIFKEKIDNSDSSLVASEM